MPLIRKAWIGRLDLRGHPDWLYLFGDNEKRRGFGGQAATCRGEPNAVGIATKRWPGHTMGAYWNNADFDRVKPIIDADFAPAFEHAKAGGTLVCAADGLGTGAAQLPQRAPRIFRYIEDKLAELAEVEIERVGDQIKAGLEEAIRVAKGEADPSTYRVTRVTPAGSPRNPEPAAPAPQRRRRPPPL